LVRSTI